MQNLLQRLRPISTATPQTVALDGLRGVAVLLVIGQHLLSGMVLWATNTGRPLFQFFDEQKARAVWGFAASGVELFFTLSGFLLFLPYARTLLGLQPPPNVRRFYIRRALRILPAYWLSLALIVLFISPQYLQPPHWGDLLAHVLLIHALDPSTLFSINGVFWSLSIELQFYLLLPLVGGALCWLMRHGQRGLAIALALFILALAPLQSWGSSLAGAPGSVISFVANITFVFRYLPIFALGAAGSLLFVYAEQQRKVNGVLPAWIVRFCRIVGVAALLGMVAYMGISSWLRPSPALDQFNLLFREPALGFIYGGLLLGVLIGWPLWNAVMSAPPICFVGAISYSVYVWNELIAKNLVAGWAIQIGNDYASLLAGIVLVVGTTLGVGFVFYTIAERPFIGLRLKQHERWNKPSVDPVGETPVAPLTDDSRQLDRPTVLANQQFSQPVGAIVHSPERVER